MISFIILADLWTTVLNFKRNDDMTFWLEILTVHIISIHSIVTIMRYNGSLSTGIFKIWLFASTVYIPTYVFW